MTLAIDPTALPLTLRGWLGSHGAFRRDADGLVAAVAALDPSDTRAAVRLADAFAVTIRMLELHHTSEDDLIFAELITRSPAFAGVLMTMSLEHVDLDDVVDDINRSLATLTGRSSRADDVHARLQHRAEVFRTLITCHMETEEEYALPMVLRCFSTDEIDAMGDAHVARAADRIDEMVPWSTSAMPPEVAAQTLATMPAEIQERFPQWSAAFAQRFAPMLACNTASAAA
jgi:hemerythrin-like domain-containing protein